MDVVDTNHVKKYLGNAGWMLLENILRMTSGVFVGAYLARYLGPDVFGEYSLILVFITLLGAVVRAGLDSVVIKEFLCDRFSTNALMTSTFFIQFLIALLCIFLLGVFCLIESSHFSFRLIIANVSLVFIAFGVVDLYFQSLVRVKYVSIVKSLQLSVSAIVKFAFITMEAPLDVFVFWLVAEQILLALGYLFVIRLRAHVAWSATLDFGCVKYLLSQSWSIWVASGLVALHARIDQLVVSSFGGFEVLGVYSAAVKITEAVSIIPIVFSVSIFPLLVDAASKSKLELNKCVSQLADWLVFLSIIAIIVMCFASRIVIEFLYGADFLQAANILIVQSFGVLFVSTGALASKWIVASGFHSYSWLRALLGVVVSLVLNVVLVHEFGALGAAVASVFALFFTGLMFFMVVKPLREFADIVVDSFVFGPVRCVKYLAALRLVIRN